MITDSPTFCGAPWTSMNIDQTGQVYPCMMSQYALGNINNARIHDIVDGAQYRELRETIAQGKWHRACVNCKRQEETTGNSPRLQRAIDDKTRAAINNDINWFMPEHVTINWSNLCNLSCTYCNPHTSTAWQAAKHIPVELVRNNHGALAEFMQEKGHNLRGLTLGGGEPLLQKGLADMLSKLDPTNINVLVTTNLSVNLEQSSVYQLLKTWPRVNWMVSFDSVDPIKFEYVRNGATWTKFLSNIHILKKDKQSIMAHPAYSIYCAFDLESYYEFCAAEQLGIFWCELIHPLECDVRRLPQHLRNKAIEQIDKVKHRWGDRPMFAWYNLDGYRKQLLDNSYLFKVNHRLDCIAWHRDIDRQLGKTVTFAQAYPELAEAVRGVKYEGTTV